MDVDAIGALVVEQSVEVGGEIGAVDDHGVVRPSFRKSDAALRASFDQRADEWMHTLAMQCSHLRLEERGYEEGMIG